jgi:hypothetical protein
MKKRRPKRQMTLSIQEDSMKKCCTSYFEEMSVRFQNPSSREAASMHQQLATDETGKRTNIFPTP